MVAIKFVDNTITYKISAHAFLFNDSFLKYSDFKTFEIRVFVMCKSLDLREHCFLKKTIFWGESLVAQTNAKIMVIEHVPMTFLFGLTEIHV